MAVPPETSVWIGGKLDLPQPDTGWHLHPHADRGRWQHAHRNCDSACSPHAHADTDPNPYPNPYAHADSNTCHDSNIYPSSHTNPNSRHHLANNNERSRLLVGRF